MREERKPVRLPAVGESVRMYGKLVKIEVVTPPVEVVRDYVFEFTTAKLEARINGFCIKEHGEFNDFYGDGTCVDAAIRDARSLVGQFGESDLEFVVIKVTSQKRMRPDPDRRENFYADQFRAMETLEYGCCRDLPEDKEEIVWSSKNDNATAATPSSR